MITCGQQLLNVSKPVAIIVSLIFSIILLTACDTIIPLDPTEVPTREYSAPTLAPTEVFYALPPTSIPIGVPVAGQNSDFAAGLPANAEIPPIVLDEPEMGVQTVQITLRDGQILAGQLYPPEPIEIEGRLLRPRLPAVLLLGTRIEWADFPFALQDAGYTVLVMDMRAIGLASAVEDMLAALSVTDSVYPALIAVMAAGANADYALIACANDPVCDALVMFSPRNQPTLANVITGFLPRPLLVVVNVLEPVSYQTVVTLQSLAGNAMQIITRETNVNGAEMLVVYPEIVDAIIAWLRDVLVE